MPKIESLQDPFQIVTNYCIKAKAIMHIICAQSSYNHQIKDPVNALRLTHVTLYRNSSISFAARIYPFHYHVSKYNIRSWFDLHRPILSKPYADLVVNLFRRRAGHLRSGEDGDLRCDSCIKQCHSIGIRDQLSKLSFVETLAHTGYK